MEVSRLHDWLGKRIETRPRLFLTLGRIETSWLRERLANIQIDRPIYITGLARSGSTILLELLASHPDTATHTYRDFPLVHIPVWWNWFLDNAGNRKEELVERTHKDGIYVTQESPEAMEEVVWMAFFPVCHDPSVSNVFHRSDGTEKFKEFYYAHIRKILLLRDGIRYLAKGNYNISRLEYLHSLMPEARFIIPVRDPIGHTASLLKQHRLFCDAETKDPRVLNYMRRSGHFEFGLDRRPINLGCIDTVNRIEKLWREGHEVRGWGVHWAAVYGFVVNLLERDEELARQCIVVHYDDLCNTPIEMLRRIYEHCELDCDQNTLNEQAKLIKAPTYYSHGFSNEEIMIIDEETRNTHSRIKKLKGQ